MSEEETDAADAESTQPSVQELRASLKAATSRQRQINEEGKKLKTYIERLQAELLEAERGGWTR